MKTGLNKPRAIRFDADLESDIEGQPETFSKAVRRLCRAGLRGSNPTIDAALLEQLEATRRTIAPIGGNLNQIAAAFNATDNIDDDALARVHIELQGVFSDLASILKEVRNATIKRIR